MMDELEKLTRDQERENDTGPSSRKYQAPESGYTDGKIDPEAPPRTTVEELIDDLGVDPTAEKHGAGFGVHDHSPRSEPVPEGRNSAGPVKAGRGRIISGRVEWSEPPVVTPPYSQAGLRRIRENDGRMLPAHRPRDDDDRAMERWAREGFTAGGVEFDRPKPPKVWDDSRHHFIQEPASPWYPPKDLGPGWREYHPESAEVPDELQSVAALMVPGDERASGVRPSVLRKFERMLPEERDRRAGLSPEEREEEEALDSVRERVW